MKHKYNSSEPGLPVHWRYDRKNKRYDDDWEYFVQFCNEHHLERDNEILRSAFVKYLHEYLDYEIASRVVYEWFYSYVSAYRFGLRYTGEPDWDAIEAITKHTMSASDIEEIDMEAHTPAFFSAVSDVRSYADRD